MLKSLSGMLARWSLNRSLRANGSGLLANGTYVTLRPNEVIKIGPINGTIERLPIYAHSQRPCLISKESGTAPQSSSSPGKSSA